MQPVDIFDGNTKKGMLIDGIAASAALDSSGRSY